MCDQKLTEKAPYPFIMDYFKFASSHSDESTGRQIIGSIYFYIENHYRRIRLTNPKGPEVGPNNPDRICYFAQSQETLESIIDALLKMGDPTMSDVGRLAQEYKVTTDPRKGYYFVEFWSYQNESGTIELGIHGSRGVVEYPEINQHDINVIYNVISRGCGKTPEEKNETLKETIIQCNLSEVLRQ